MFSHIDSKLNDFVQTMPETGEGFITAGQAEFMWSLVRLTRPRIVAETGLNAGHSACVILRAMETYGGGTLMSFDNGRHDATQKAADLIKERYPTFHYIRGDTKETLAGTMAQALGSNSDATLDLAIVDGGHDVETARTTCSSSTPCSNPAGFSGSTISATPPASASASMWSAGNSPPRADPATDFSHPTIAA